MSERSWLRRENRSLCDYDIECTLAIRLVPPFAGRTVGIALMAEAGLLIQSAFAGGDFTRSGVRR